MNSQSNNNFNNPRSIPGQCQGPNQYPINPNQYNVNPNPNYNQIPNASSEQVDKWFKSPAKPTAVPGDPANPLTDQIYPSLQAPPSQTPKTTNPPPPPSPETLYYPMRNPRRRGHCLILNYATFDQFQVGGGSREGTETDVHTLVTTFTTLGFDVLQPYTNLTRQATIDVLYFESKVNHADADCFALCILSHGDRNDVIYCTDGPLKVDYILGLFTSEKCASLMGKPKLFFIQACRGNQVVQPPVGKTLGSHDLPTERKGAENSGSDGIFFLLPNYADFLIFYSTYPGKNRFCE